MQRSLAPVSDRAGVISDNVEFITQAVRADVEQLNDSVKGLTDRLKLASERMEERIEEFNALMEVVQEEAEEIFIDTAATVRGVRHGAATIGRPEDERPEAPEEPTAEAPAEAESPETVATGEGGD